MSLDVSNPTRRVIVKYMSITQGCFPVGLVSQALIDGLYMPQMPERLCVRGWRNFSTAQSEREIVRFQFPTLTEREA